MSNGWTLGLAEKPKVEELQMDWLRSEDLNEEKNVTASAVIIAVGVYCCLSLARGVREAVNEFYKVGMSRKNFCLDRRSELS